jgi:8-oxo-dGTP diphosphatase
LGIKSAATPLADTKNAFTSRLKRRRWPNPQEFEAMNEMFSVIRDKAIRLLDVKVADGNEWNSSVEAWSSFLDNHPIYDETMQDLLDHAEVRGTDRVLELGCGTGQLSKRIAERLVHGGRLVLVDNAVQMIEASKSQMKGSQDKVEYLLSDVRSPQPLYGPARSMRYDKIICHFSFHHFIDLTTTVFKFASKWRSMLAPDGKVVLSVHDTLLADEDGTYDDKLRDAFAAEGFAVIPALHSFRVSDIVGDFKNAGYELVVDSKQTYERTYRDRVSMWKSPMILKGIIKGFTHEKDYQRAMHVLDQVDRKWGHEESHPTTVRYMVFRKGGTRVTANAIIANRQGQVLVVKKNGRFLLPGGKPVGNENELDTLRREVKEETGLVLLSQARLGTYNYVEAFGEQGSLQMKVYLATVADEAPRAASEITELQWLDPRQIHLLDRALYPVSWWAPIFADYLGSQRQAEGPRVC